MAKSKQTVETGFSFEELAEQLVVEAGGVTELAKMIVTGAKDDSSSFTREKFITLIARIMKQAMPRQQASDSLTDEEIEKALTQEIIRHFVSMSEDDYRGTIANIEKLRRQEDHQETPGVGVQQDGKDVPANDGTDGNPQHDGQDVDAVETNQSASSDSSGTAVNREVEPNE